MESYIQISKINDFLYSPKSLYLHSVYESFDQVTYHEVPQKAGKMSHALIEKSQYSSAKRYLQGLAVYSSMYNIGGKIDIYDIQTKSLIERKTKIKKIYKGYIYQLYAQMFCLEEVGYIIEKLFIHSLVDNKRYLISKPSKQDKKDFTQTLANMRKYDLLKLAEDDTLCDISIYRHLTY